MFILDSALKQRADQDRPVRVGLLGAGFMARGLANRIVHGPAGMTLAAVYARRIDRARELERYCGVPDGEVTEAGGQNALDSAIREPKPVITEDAFLLARSEHIDVIVDTTGSVEFGARVILE